MNDFFAVLRLDRCEHPASFVHPRTIEMNIADCLRPVPGVRQVAYEASGCEALVWLDRNMATMGDLVRSLEDAGMAVLSVAHWRAVAKEESLPA